LVVDEVSGLALLRLTNAKLPPLEVASQAPAVGSWVMSGSAYGGEPAAVSLGVIGGANRMIGGGALPPLMQCDLRTTNTSSGGPIVDRGGRLLSVVIAVDDGNKRAGWTYAAPASHVSRILREWKERGDKQDQNQELLVLKRRRPVVGLVLDQEGALIVVGRVHANSPAASAGLKPGDRIVAVDGVHIRSVYQAVRPLLFKQPGEQVTYRIRRAGDEQPEREIQVALGDQQAVLAKGPLRAPKLDVVTTPGGYRSEAGDRKRELVHPDDPRKKPVVTTPQRQIELLEQALDGYRNVIIYQQDQIRDLKKRLEQLEKAGEPRQ
jgi:S1-C subfamily serine protease